MAPHVPSTLQRQHRAFMAKALKTAPGSTQQEKMRYAAAAWRRQKGGKGKASLKPVLTTKRGRVPLLPHHAPTPEQVRASKIKGKGVLSSILKAAPYIFKAAKLGAKIGSKIVAPHHEGAANVLDMIGGLGVGGKAKRKYTRRKH